jgi:hypothetical protein
MSDTHPCCWTCFHNRPAGTDVFPTACGWWISKGLEEKARVVPLTLIPAGCKNWIVGPPLDLTVPAEERDQE